MKEYNKIAELATETARKFTREEVIDVMYAPLQLLYVEMVGRKEIPAIRDLDLETREKYKSEINERLAGREKYRRIWSIQAVYLYDLITKS